MDPKANLRQCVRARLLAASMEAAQDGAAKIAVAQSSHSLNERLIRLFELLFQASLQAQAQRPSPQLWAAYQPHGHEPDLRPALLKIASAHSVEWVFPRVQGTEMEFYLPEDEMSYLQNHWNLREPDPGTSKKIEGHEICGFLIPALAFDHAGNRMGRGKGYFDRYLARLNHKTKTKIGIAFDQQILNDLPVEPHDVAMDLVLSDRRCFVSRDWISDPAFETRGRRELVSRWQAVIPSEEFVSSSADHFSERTKS